MFSWFQSIFKTKPKPESVLDRFSGLGDDSLAFPSDPIAGHMHRDGQGGRWMYVVHTKPELNGWQSVSRDFPETVWLTIPEDEDDFLRTGKDVWLGWKPMVPDNPLSRCSPRLGHWDVGSKQWILQWEDHGDEGGLTPVPFRPQPDYYCEGFIPTAPIG